MKHHIKLQKDTLYDNPYFVFFDSRLLKGFAELEQAEIFYEEVKANPEKYVGKLTVKEDFVEIPANEYVGCTTDEIFHYENNK